MTGPRQAQPAYDYVLQGMAGWMSLTGEPDGPPTKSGLSLVDFCGGLVAAQATLAGIIAARRDGFGMDCDVSLFDTTIAMLSYPATWQLTGGFEPRRRAFSAHPSLVPFQNFATADGWIVVACPKEKFWRRLAEALERPDLATDPRFADFEQRRRNESELLPLLGEEFARRTTAEWLSVLTRFAIPCGPVSSVAEALADQQTVARNMVVETEHPRFGVVRQVASPVRVGEARTSHRRGPRRGEDGSDILAGLLGYDVWRRATLSEAGAFGPPDDLGAETAR